MALKRKVHRTTRRKAPAVRRPAVSLAETQRLVQAGGVHESSNRDAAQSVSEAIHTNARAQADVTGDDTEVARQEPR